MKPKGQRPKPGSDRSVGSDRSDRSAGTAAAGAQILILILALSGLLALGYAWATPVGAAPDEGAHLHYVQVLADEHRLPALNLEQRRGSYADANYEAHQPPLYYTLAVPFFAAGRAIRGDSGAGQACRLLSILLGLGGTVLIRMLARELVPERPVLWDTAAAVAAFLPMRLAVLASVSNDTLTEAASTLAILLMLRMARKPCTAGDTAILGLTIGAALLTKQSTIILLPPALLALALSPESRVQSPESEPGQEVKRSRDPTTDRHPEPSPRAGGLARTGTDSDAQDPRPKTQDLVINPPDLRIGFAASLTVFGAVVLLLSGWWFARNHALYGDPLGMRAFNWYFEDTRRWVDFRDEGMSYGHYLGRLVLPTTFASFWGAFGHLEKPERFMGFGRSNPLTALLSPLWPIRDYPWPSWVYPLLVLATLISATGGAAWLLRRRRLRPTPNTQHPAPLAIPVLHALFVLAAFLNFNATYFQAQGRYLFPALGITVIGLAGGWLEWTLRREHVGAVVIGALMLALAAYALFGVIQPGFAS